MCNTESGVNGVGTPDHPAPYIARYQQPMRPHLVISIGNLIYKPSNSFDLEVDWRSGGTLPRRMLGTGSPKSSFGAKSPCFGTIL